MPATRIKFCSITNLDDALAAVDAGADYVGFIGVPDTPRHVTAAQYRALVERLPETVTPVVVVRDAADALPYAPRAVQYYGGDVARLDARIKLFPVIRPRTLDDLALLGEIAERAAAVIVDAYHPDTLGGAGIAGDWDTAAEALRRCAKPVMLAGGLTPMNVAEAIRRVEPFAVDVSSGVESSPRKKDHEKMRAFAAAVRAADAER